MGRRAAGSTAYPDVLVEWATARVPERAAVPKDVYVVDALPLTDVGKPYKVALRADATERAAAAALADLDAHVSATVTDQGVLVRVKSPDESGVRFALAPFTFPWEFV